jgi:hypothetical protein
MFSGTLCDPDVDSNESHPIERLEWLSGRLESRVFVSG